MSAGCRRETAREEREEQTRTRSGFLAPRPQLYSPLKNSVKIFNF